MIETRKLVKTFGPHSALDGVSLSIERGEIVALVGPNGAGKTTLLRILATLARPTSGSVRMAGLDVARAGIEIRRRVGFLSHRSLLYDDLSADQNLHFYARMYDVPDASTRIEELLTDVGLLDRRAEPVRTLSRGMQQRLALARVLLHRPDMLLLDEPHSGLDLMAADALTRLLAELSTAGRTILLTTHDLGFAAQLRRRVVVLVRGRVARDARAEDLDPASLRASYIGVRA